MGAVLSLFLARPPTHSFSKPAIAWEVVYENDAYDYKIDAEIYTTSLRDIALDIEGIDKLDLLYALWCNATRASFILTSNTIPPSFDVEAA